MGPALAMSGLEYGMSLRRDGSEGGVVGVVGQGREQESSRLTEGPGGGRSRTLGWTLRGSMCRRKAERAG